jgi:hypothetical protein
MDIKNITQTDVMSLDVLSLRTFCRHRHFVPQMLCPGMFCPSRMFCPTGCFVPPDICPSGRFVLVHYDSGRHVSGRFVWAVGTHANENAADMRLKC